MTKKLLLLIVFIVIFAGIQNSVTYADDDVSDISEFCSLILCLQPPSKSDFINKNYYSNVFAYENEQYGGYVWQVLNIPDIRQEIKDIQIEFSLVAEDVEYKEDTSSSLMSSVLNNSSYYNLDIRPYDYRVNPTQPFVGPEQHSFSIRDERYGWEIFGRLGRRNEDLENESSAGSFFSIAGYYEVDLLGKTTIWGTPLVDGIKPIWMGSARSTYTAEIDSTRKSDTGQIDFEIYFNANFSGLGIYNRSKVLDGLLTVSKTNDDWSFDTSITRDLSNDEVLALWQIIAPGAYSGPQYRITYAEAGVTPPEGKNGNDVYTYYPDLPLIGIDCFKIYISRYDSTGARSAHVTDNTWNGVPVSGTIDLINDINSDTISFVNCQDSDTFKIWIYNSNNESAASRYPVPPADEVDLEEKGAVLAYFVIKYVGGKIIIECPMTY